MCGQMDDSTGWVPVNAPGDEEKSDEELLTRNILREFVEEGSGLVPNEDTDNEANLRWWNDHPTVEAMVIKYADKIAREFESSTWSKMTIQDLRNLLWWVDNNRAISAQEGFPVQDEETIKAFVENPKNFYIPGSEEEVLNLKTTGKWVEVSTHAEADDA